ncbi:MAG: DUF523 domain-containing protein [Deltaproteobacteria bacterium]|nr:MAG: DUF523 domain-containing protein [Deltaproteobacteria bacterium]
MKPRIAISRCLLGDAVRYDGGHEEAPFLRQVEVEWVPVCPEVELGMPVPRERIRLEGAQGCERLVGESSRRDWTEAMRRFARRRIEALLALPVHGFVLKSKSPSCGLGSTKRWIGGQVVRDGTGLFAAEVRTLAPALPLAEERELEDPAALAAFLDRCRARLAS